MKKSITLKRHDHPLTLVNNTTTPTSSKTTLTTSTSYLNNFKVIGSCGGCKEPIVDTIPFYKCEYKSPYKCNYFLHEWCTRFPAKLKNCCMRDPQHTLSLRTQKPPYEWYYSDIGVVRCDGCESYIGSDEFFYRCDECIHPPIHPTCALIPKRITHISHPYHLLSRVKKRSSRKDYCRMCLSSFTSDKETSLSCEVCEFHLHPACALLFPETIRVKYDKHPMGLNFGPVENHEGDYFCEVCEDELNPQGSFYHCQECVQSVHLACAPNTPQSKAYMYRLFRMICYVYDTTNLNYFASD